MGQNIFKKLPKIKHFALPLFAVILTLAIALGYGIFLNYTIFPGVKVAGINVGGLEKAAAEQKISKALPEPQKVVLTYEDKIFEIDTKDLALTYDYSKTTDDAFAVNRTNNLVQNIATGTKSAFTKPSVPLVTKLDENMLNEKLLIISRELRQDPIFPNVKIVGSEIEVENGKAGTTIDIESLQKQILEAIASHNNSEIRIVASFVNPELTESELLQLKARARNFIGKSITLKFEFQEIVLNDSKLVNLIKFDTGLLAARITELQKEIRQKIDREPQNPVFVFENAKVKEFSPAKDGVTLDEDKLATTLEEKISELETADLKSLNVALPVTTVSPTITTNEVNDLGIRELIGRGTSKFAGSIPSRIHNVGLAAASMNGVLVEPGAILSFNETVGDVSALTGYKQAYIIQDGKTVLGDGGGVCQVSTTLFRAVLNAGLPVVERRSHSYRVAYYEQGSPAGLDATVFSPTTDFKFKNDTPGHILIQTIFDAKTTSLIFEIYGTKDGRVATITEPVVAGVAPPPEDLYIDDPTLPVGQVKQIDFKAWGAKASFNYKVEKNGEIIYEKTFLSAYRPWQAKFLRGTAPI